MGTRNRSKKKNVNKLQTEDLFIVATDEYEQEVPIIVETIIRCPRAKSVTESGHGTIIIGHTKAGLLGSGNKMVITGKRGTLEDEVISIEIDRERVGIALPDESIGICLKSHKIPQIAQII